MKKRQSIDSYKLFGVNVMRIGHMGGIKIVRLFHTEQMKECVSSNIALLDLPARRLLDGVIES